MAWFKEGLFVIKASTSFNDLLGSRVNKVNGLDIDEMRQVFRKYNPGNEYNKKQSLHGLIIRPDIWNWVDTTYSPDYVIVELLDPAGIEQIDTIGIETITSTLINLYWESCRIQFISNTTIVGEPNGDNLFWSFASGDLDVDVPVEVSINEYINYEDPVMERVLELIKYKNDR